jgi:signal transduction histidine kinase
MSVDPAPPTSAFLDHQAAVSELKEAERSGRIPEVLAAEAAPTAILDTRRELVYANDAFRGLVGARSVNGLYGGRPGEILRCVHAENGCGDSDWCEFCGALQAFQEARTTGRLAVRECHIDAETDERGSTLDFSVRATPFALGDHPYVMLSFTDISHQKRRMALEKIFFHDILNTASSLRVYVDLLRRGVTDEASRSLIARLSTVCDTLEEEIQGQRILVSAENGTLKPQRNLIEAREMALQLKTQAEGLEIARGRTVALAAFSEPFTLIADDSLVKRILGNMLKNALEASPEGAAVTIGFRRDTEGAAAFTVHNPTAMERAVQRQVFTRYFSTKEKDRGLGTWGMRMLAEEYCHGRVSFRSSPEEGTTFVLTLPRKPPNL